MVGWVFGAGVDRLANRKFDNRQTLEYSHGLDVGLETMRHE